MYATHLGNSEEDDEKITLDRRINMGYEAVRDIIKKVWLYVALGIAGSRCTRVCSCRIYGFVYGKKDVWYAVPLSVLIGIPLYSNAAGIVPIVSVLIEKGAALGTALAFMMSVIALSLPEMIILQKGIEDTISIITFAIIVGFGIMLVGFLFNYLF